MNKKRSLSLNITIMVIGMVFVSSVFVGAFAYFSVQSDLYRLTGLTAQTAVDAIASSLDPKAVKILDSTEIENFYYHYLKKTLNEAGKRTNYKFIYVLTMDEDNFKLLYGQSCGGKSTLPLGYRIPVQSLSEASIRAYTMGVHTYSQPYSAGNHGHFISGYAPVIDDSGEVVAILGMDIPLDDVNKELAYVRNTIILILAAFLALFSIISTIYTKRAIGVPIAALTEMSEDVVKGKLDYSADIKSDSEIGLLYDNFKKMQETLKEFCVSLNAMSDAQSNGDIDATIDTDKFVGAYKDMAIGVNKFVTEIHDEVAVLLDAFKRVSSGDFDTELPVHPGKKIVANEAFDSVKESLQSVYTGINVLVKNTTEDEFPAGTEVSQYSGDWAPLINKIVNFHLEAEEQRQMILASIDYASKIQRNLLPEDDAFEQAFSDYSVRWSPKDVVGGDIYWIKNFSEGTLLCVCDCTGHGTPGALLTMLVVSAFEIAINEINYKDTAGVIWMLEKRLVSVLSVTSGDRGKGCAAEIHDGCDLAVLYIAKDGSVTISAGHTNVFVCDGTKAERIKGQKLSVGEGKIKEKDEIKTTHIPASPDNKFYIASDGLFDQIGGEPPRPFGYQRFADIILENHNEKQAVVSERILEAFESYRGEQQRRDDFELITFKP